MIKNSKGFTQTDIVVAVVAIIFFTTLIVALMTNVKVQSAKLKGKLLANIYLTEALENVGILQYDYVTEENKDLIFPKMTDVFTSQLSISKLTDEDNTKDEDVIKKVEVKITYKIGNKTYEETAQRLKVKE